MKRLLLIPAIVGTMAMASDAQYEITPLIGYNIAEGNLNLDNEILTGIEAQYTGCKFPIKPEFSALYSGGVKSEDLNPSNKTNILRLALNGVYEFADIGGVSPFAKAGFGYETMNRHFADNSDGAFVDAGAGVKIPFTEDLALKLETIYMLKRNQGSAGGTWGDSNLAVLAGLNFAFGQKAATEPAPVAEPEQTPVVEAEPTPEPVNNDNDNDGVVNSLDQCPTTPANVTKVDAEGCAEIVNLHVNFEFDSHEVTEASLENIKKFGEFMNNRTEYKAVITGHTDSTGPAAYNQKLSQERAKAVSDLVISKGGVDSSRITSIGKGESEPTASNDTKDGRAQNRRTEAELIKE